MTTSTNPQSKPLSPEVNQPVPLAREAGAAMACPPAVPANDWLRPAAVLGALALLLAAFHGVRQEIKDVRQEVNGVRQEIQGVRQEIQGVWQEIRASEESLRADNRALNEKLDRLLETLLQP